MDSHPTPLSDALLVSLARTFLWYARPDEQDAIKGQVRQHLGGLDNPEFDMDTWARDILKGMDEQDVEQFTAEASPLVIRSGSHIGLEMGQTWNERLELTTAVQIHPRQRVVFVEGWVETLKRDEVISAMRDEITAVLTRARFLGVDPLTIDLLCQEALTISRALDVERLWAEAENTPTLGDGEAINHLVSIVSVTLHEPFRVTVTFDDGVSRVLDLAPFIQGPQFAPVRRPNFFVQLCVSKGTLRWPNGTSLDPAQLRYTPALTLNSVAG